MDPFPLLNVVSLLVALQNPDHERSLSAECRFRRKVIQDAPSADRPVVESVAGQPRFASFDPMFLPPAGTATFTLSQDYPSVYDTTEAFSWSDIDFRSNGVSYLKAVLAYCLEGNVEVDFRGQDNAVRKWYHAPWMHDDSKEGGARQGREYHHGLTRERGSRAGELHPMQTSEYTQNWAVGMYSERGGYTIGNVWLTPDGFPDPSQATFPDNTVAFKLLFTAASPTEVPYLAGSFKWTANINPTPMPAPGAPFQRVDQELRLLQLDVAVKDPRAAQEAGWVFGTFVFDASQPGSVWDKLVPVGVSWGDDSDEKLDLERGGSFLNPRLKQSSLNASLVEPPAGTDWGSRAYARHFGLGGRLNGPVDNPFSSCISCHGRAGSYAASLPLNAKSGEPMPNLVGKGTRPEQVNGFRELFRPIRPNSHLEQAPLGAELGTFVTVDYSLQLSQGIRNFYESLRRDRDRLASLRGAQGSEAAVLETLPTSEGLAHVSSGD